MGLDHFFAAKQRALRVFDDFCEGNNSLSAGYMGLAGFTWIQHCSRLFEKVQSWLIDANGFLKRSRFDQAFELAGCQCVVGCHQQ